MQTDRNTDNKPVMCDSCKSSMRVDALSHLEYRMLQDQYYYEGFQGELRMLMRVQNLYRRHPEIEVIAADIFQARLFEKAEPNYNTVLLAKLADSDFEILEYLRDNAFTLLPRLKFVRQRVAELRERLKPVTCPFSSPVNCDSIQHLDRPKLLHPAAGGLKRRYCDSSKQGRDRTVTR
jgi:hypothetical protein